MLKQIKFLLFFLLVVVFFISPAHAFLNGGYTTGIAPGDCFLTFSTFTVSSNTVNVNTIRIDNIISDRTYVSTNMESIPVSVSITNTGVIPATFNLSLVFYNVSLGNTENNYAQAANNFTNPITLAAGITATYSFYVTPNTSIAATYPVVVDGRALNTGSTPPNLGNDFFWTAVDGTRVTGAVNPLLWDTRDAPSIIAATVSPSVSSGGLTELFVTFSRGMDSSQPPIFQVVSPDMVTIAGNWAGNWIGAVPTVSWTGTINTTGWAEGTYYVSGSMAVDTNGITMNANSNIVSFEIDRSPPTVNLTHNPTANPGINFAVTLVAVDSDVIPLAPVLYAEFLHTDGSTSNVAVGGWSSVGGQGITWSGTVLVPVDATPNSIATFNSLIVTDNAGNTSNVINSGATFNIGIAIPQITNLTFDGVAVIDGDIIDSTPLIHFYIIDSANSGGIATASIRITMNGTLLVSGSALTLISIVPNMTYECTYEITNPLSERNYTFEFGASDIGGAPATPVQVTVRVIEGDVDLLRQPINWTNPFSPNGDGVEDVTYIIYELTKSAAVKVLIFNMDGEVVWRQDIDEGQEGAHAGYNSVVWDGYTSFGDNLPNGVYIAHIIVNDNGSMKSLGRAKIVILK
ncbi:MAG: gliding motility-associated C-terminal domain-containing protein [Candidatus Margulisbacteria bacterium]|nr:gliding motility-associated C-terminal domain-containing protein [Candidatus Margulisiibacteriota bacterium]